MRWDEDGIEYVRGIALPAFVAPVPAWVEVSPGRGPDRVAVTLVGD